MTQSPDHDQLTARCADALTDLATVARPAVSAWSQLDLSTAQLKAVMLLTCHGPRPVGELGRALGMSEPGASVLADRLEEAGFASRQADEHDRRRTLVVPTPAARELSERLRQAGRERIERWLDRMADDDLRALLAGVGALTAAVRATADEPVLERTTT